MMDRILIKLYVPYIEEIYDIWIPSHKRIGNVINLLVKAINELNEGEYNPNQRPMLYDKITAKIYDPKLSVKDTTIRNGTELILL